MPKQDTTEPPPPYKGAGDSMNRARYKTMQQSKYNGDTGNNPDAFVALPEPVVERIGLYTHMGARMECAVLSRLLYEADKQDTSEREIAFQGDENYTKQGGRFVLSIETIARDIWQRWFHEDGDGDKYEKFYGRIQRGSVTRLEDDGWVRREGHPHGERCYGCVWTFQGTFLDGSAHKLPQTTSSGARLLHTGAGVSEEPISDVGEGVVNATDVIGEAFVAAHPKQYRQGEIVTSLTSRGSGQWGDIYAWCRQIAQNGASGERFTTVGAWASDGEQGRADRPHTIPWITIDIDRSHLPDALESAKRILSRLEDMGTPLEKLHVSFSGKKGFHIRIPSGMAGAPVYANRGESKRILRRWIEHVSDENTDLEVADPRQHIRLIGSVRDNGAHVVAWRANAFLSMTLQGIMEHSKEHHPYQIGDVDPLTIASVPSLVQAMVGSMDTTRKADIPSWSSTKDASNSKESGVMRRAMEGCEEGVVWWDKGDTIHCGRSKLLFMASCHLIRKHGRRAAWAKIQEVNDKCEPPMGDRKLKGRFESAKRTVGTRR